MIPNDLEQLESFKKDFLIFIQQCEAKYGKVYPLYLDTNLNDCMVNVEEHIISLGERITSDDPGYETTDFNNE